MGLRCNLRGPHPLLWGVYETLGAFSHSANYYVVCPGNTPESHPPTEACMIHSKRHDGWITRDGSNLCATQGVGVGVGGG